MVRHRKPQQRLATDLLCHRSATRLPLLPHNQAGWQTVQLKFADFKPVFRARTQLGVPPINAANICSLQLMLSKFEADGALNPTFKEGAFQLPVQQISGEQAGRRAGGRPGGLASASASVAGAAAIVCLPLWPPALHCRLRLRLRPAHALPALQPTWRSP